MCCHRCDKAQGRKKQRRIEIKKMRTKEKLKRESTKKKDK
jgi:hypothetical protein